MATFDETLPDMNSPTKLFYWFNNWYNYIVDNVLIDATRLYRPEKDLNQYYTWVRDLRNVVEFYDLTPEYVTGFVNPKTNTYQEFLDSVELYRQHLNFWYTPYPELISGLNGYKELWTFNDPSTTATAYTNSAYNGTYTNATNDSTNVFLNGVNTRNVDDGVLASPRINLASGTYDNNFDWEAGWISVWFKFLDVAKWTDGLNHFILRFEYDDTVNPIDRISLFKSTTNNQVAANVTFNNVAVQITTNSTADTNWHHMYMTWKDGGLDNLVFYYDGVLIGSSPIANSALTKADMTKTLLGAYDSAGQFVLDGNVSHYANGTFYDEDGTLVESLYHERTFYV